MKNKKIWIAAATVLIGAGAAFVVFGKYAPNAAPQGGGFRGGGGAGMPVPVLAATASSGDSDVTVDGLGTVVARNTAVVKARVDGLLNHINFREGQITHAGDVLAEIDPRPFQVALDQAHGQLARDQALLANAKLDRERYQGLLAQDSIAKQQVDAQESLVHQDEGVVALDRAQVDNAKLQLGFAHITAPISGRLGLRQIDVGNMIHAADANGLVVITQTQPIMVVFSISADSLSSVLARLHDNAILTVEAYDRSGKSKLASGKLLTVDNQLDASTGTVKLKAEFSNSDETLFPNQFVNARLHVETRHNATLIPATAIQRGTPGTFVYLIAPDQTVSVRPVTLSAGTGDMVVIEQGLQAGDRVVILGAEKLRAGSKVTTDAAQASGDHANQNSAAGNRHGSPPASGVHPAHGGADRQERQ